MTTTDNLEYINKPQGVSDELFRRQLELENEGIQLGISKYQDTMLEAYKTNTVSSLPIGIRMVSNCIEPFVVEYKKKLLMKNGGSTKAKIVKFFEESGLDAYEIAFVATKTILNYAKSKENSATTIAKTIVIRLTDEMNYVNYTRDYKAYVKAVEEAKKFSTKGRIMVALKHVMEQKGIKPVQVEKELEITLGLELIYLFVSATGLVDLVDDMDERTKKTTKRLLPSDGLLEKLDNSFGETELIEPIHMPMLIKPRDWVSPTEGAFYSLKKNLKDNLCILKGTKSRPGSKEQMKLFKQADMSSFYKAVNGIQKTAWKINSAVLEVASNMWKSNIEVGDSMPQVSPKPPLKPWSIPLEDKERWEEYKKNNPETVKKYFAEATQFYNEDVRFRSKRTAVEEKLITARRFKGEKEIYFTWNADWRGRLYPMQGHLNPQGDDLAKALLMFAEGKQVTTKGLYWYRVHGANVWGEDKVSFDDRVKWVLDNEEMLIRIAQDPYVNKEWMKADKPFCFLAFTFEYVAWLDDNTLPLRVPVAMDGSNNGLQHFSALLRDPVGGLYTNVIPNKGGTPEDIYNVVLQKVLTQIREEDHIYKEILLEVVNRKVVKTPCMTLSYGVTYMGMRDQVFTELEKKLKKEYSKDQIVVMTKYVTDLTYAAIRTTVKAAVVAMDYFQDLAKTVSKEFEKPIIWKTPIGFPVVQKYVKSTSKRINTFMGKTRIRVNIAENTNKINTQKQALGVSPNLIHSLDACALQMTVLRLLDKGITSIALIHDSYGTHAEDIETLNKELREAFFELYNKDIFNTLVDGILDGAEVDCVRPELGDMDISLVKESPYFFA